MLSLPSSPIISRSVTPISATSSKNSSPVRSRTSSAQHSSTEAAPRINLNILSVNTSPRHTRVRQFSDQTESMQSIQATEFLASPIATAVPPDALNQRLEHYLAEQSIQGQHFQEQDPDQGSDILSSGINQEVQSNLTMPLLNKADIIVSIRQHLVILHGRHSAVATQPPTDFQKSHHQQVAYLLQRFPYSFGNSSWQPYEDQLPTKIEQLLSDFTLNLPETVSLSTAQAFGASSPLGHYLNFHSRPGFESAGLEPLLTELSFYLCHLAALPNDQRELLLTEFPNTAFSVREVLNDEDFTAVTETCVPGTFNRLSDAIHQLRCLISPGFKENNYYPVVQQYIQKQIASLDLIKKVDDALLEVHIPPALLLSQGIPESELNDIYAKLTLSEIHATDIYDFNRDFISGIIQEKIKYDITEVGRTYSPRQEHQHSLAQVAENIMQTTGYKLLNSLSSERVDKAELFPYFVNEDYEHTHFNENHFNDDIEQLVERSSLVFQNNISPDYNTLVSEKSSCEKIIEGWYSNNTEVFRQSVDALYAIGGPFRSNSPALFGYLHSLLPKNDLAFLHEKSHHLNMPDITQKINQLIPQYSKYRVEYRRYMGFSAQQGLDLQNQLFNYLVTLGAAPLWLLEQISPPDSFNEHLLDLSDEALKALVMRPDVIKAYGEVFDISDSDVCQMVFDAVITHQDKTIETLKSIFTTIHLDVPLNDDEQTPLHLAAENNDSNAIQQLLQLGASPHCKDSDQATPMMLAIEYGSYEALRVLCQHCPSLMEIDNGQQGNTPIRNAVYMQDLDALNILIEHQAILDPIDNEGETPLFYIMEELLTSDVDDNEGKAHLIDVMNILISAGVDVNHDNYRHKTPIHLAIKTGDAVVLETLLRASTFKPCASMGCMPYGYYAKELCQRPSLLPLLQHYNVDINEQFRI